MTSKLDQSLDDITKASNDSRPKRRSSGGGKRGRGRSGRRSGRGGGRKREAKKTYTAEELDAQMDNYHKFEGKLDELESAKAAGQPTVLATAEVVAPAATEEAKEE